MNYSYFIQDPSPGSSASAMRPAAAGGTNWGHYCDQDMEKLFNAVRTSFDPAEQQKALEAFTRSMWTTRCS